MIKVTINGKAVEVESGTTILAAARKVNVEIPALCYTPDLPSWGSCGICIVKLAGQSKMLRACTTACDEGMNIITHDAEIISVRRTVMELILSNHPDECLQCVRNGDCELQIMAAKFGIREAPFKKEVPHIPTDDTNPAIVLCPQKCIHCGRCVEVCQKMQNVWALEFLGRGFHSKIASASETFGEGPCVKCGQCTAHCPVGAIYGRDDTAQVWKALQTEGLHTVVQLAPAVRVALAENFGLQPGEVLTGKIYAALRRLGFDTVFDTNFSADLTIMEESAELVKRLGEKGSTLPLITTCCPSWVDYLEKYYPDMIPHFSTAKSPMQMMGVMVKAYWAAKAGLDPAKVFSVAVMPCTAKKWETRRGDEMKGAGVFLGKDVGYDVDVVITTRELSRMIKQAGIELLDLAEEKADAPLGPHSGAGVIFGVTGGVMEAAVRTAYFSVTQKELADVNLKVARGLEGIKEGEVDFGNGTKIRIAVAHQLANIASVLDRIKAAKEAGREVPYHFVEVMACRGGCCCGGGQPRGFTDAEREKRAAGIYSIDEKSEHRCSHQNPYIQQAYKEFLGEPGGDKAHKLLHTHYTERPLYTK